MSENTTSPEHQPEQPDHGRGAFVGGSFGSSDNAEDHQTTAQQIEAEQENPSPQNDQAPAAAQEFVTEPSDADTFASDVEGTGTGPSPGERNEPV